jgi:peroxiredoxin
MLTRFLGLLTAAAAALSGQQPPSQAPDATFDGAAGKVALRDYRGKQAVVLLFMRGFDKDMACYYCGEQTRAYRSNYADFHDAGAEVLMVLPLAKDIAGYVRKVGESAEPPDPKFTLPFPVVIDADGSACAAFHVPTKKPDFGDPFPVSAPATVVIGKDGRILFEHHGDDPSDRPEASKVLEVLRTGTTAPGPAKSVSGPVPTRAWLAYTDGMQLAKTKRQPILLEFHAVW